MFTWTLGPCSKRAEPPDYLAAHQVSDQLSDYDLTCLLDFHGFLDVRLGGHRLVLNHLDNWSGRWMPGERIHILNLFCGRGDLARAVVEWGKARKLDLQVLASDPSPALIERARERHGKCREIIFDVRDLNAPEFLQAQQFDYVISLNTLRFMTFARAVSFLKTANLLSKRGFVLSDWLRDVRGWMWVTFFSRVMGDDRLQKQASLALCSGFTRGEAKRLAREAGLNFASIQKHLGYRFSIAGERGLALSPKLNPFPRLAGI